MGFKEISAFEMQGNPFDLLHKQWALVTAGNGDVCNTMTVSWGGLGILWNQPSATIYVRPQRYTHEFVEREDHFTLSFFGTGKQRAALDLLGTKSGRDGDKIAEAGLTVQLFDGQPAFAEAGLVLVCRKVYRQQMEEENLLVPDALAHYPARDFHTVYIGHIEKVFVKD